jgi:hypothetical protein
MISLASTLSSANMSKAIPQDAFMEEVRRLRAAYMEQRDSTNLIPPTGPPIFEEDIDIVDGVMCYTFWYDHADGTDPDNQGKECQVVRLADIPGTLSGAILRLECDLPTLDIGNDYEIIGDDIRRLINRPPLPYLEDDSEDISAALASLPQIEVDPDVHFVKKGKYVSEVRNLLACQGGSCPGTPKSPYIIQLLGKSPNGELVFEKYTPHWALAILRPLSVYKTWILQLIDGLRCLHSLDIVHRDLRIANLLFSHDHSRLLICDLEGRWGNQLAPEISPMPVLDAGWTKKSDIYDLGMTIKGMVYGNVPVTLAVEWHIPPPLDTIVECCTRASPEDRPSLDEIYAMVEKIEI